MTIYIYGLSDPYTGKIRYVGKSIDPKKRLKDHIVRSKNGTRRKERWIQSLIKRNAKPELVILETVNEDNWESREIAWIKIFREKGYDLCNHTDGGDGIHNPDQETRKRMSDIRKKLFMNDEYRTMMLKVARSPKRRKKISDANKGRKKTKEHIAKLPQNSPGWKHSKEAIEKIRKSSTGRKHSKETKEKMRIAHKGNKYGLGNKSRTGQTIPRDERLKKSRALANRPKTSEHCKRISDGMKKRWKENPPCKKGGGWKRIDWPEYEWIEKQLEVKTIKELSSKLDVKPGTLSGKIYRERKKKRSKKQ